MFPAALELEVRLIVEGDVIEFAGGQAGFFQTILDGADRELLIVLSARKALFLAAATILPSTTRAAAES